MLSEASQSPFPFNTAVRQVVSSYITKFEALMRKGPPETGQFAFPGQLYCTWKKSLLDAHVASVIVVGSAQYPSAAHPLAVAWTFNYDLATSHILTFTDLFKPGSRYLQLLSSESRQLLRAHYGPNPSSNDHSYDGGTEPKASNFTAWSLTPSGLEITFQDYQVAAYVYGQPTVTIPFSVLAPVANPSGPLVQH